MAECSMYKHNVPSLIIEKHHVVPLSWWIAAGKPVDTPIAQLCPTCHMNTHYALDVYVKNGAGRRRSARDLGRFAGFYVTPSDLLAGWDTVPVRSKKLAEEGIRLGKAAGLTPKGTL